MRAELSKEIASRLANAPHKERGILIREYAKMYNISIQQVYRLAAKGGYKAGKKARADKGVLKCGATEEDFKFIAGMQKQTRRKNKTILMPTTVAFELANDVKKLEGSSIINAHVSTINRHLRIRGISRKHLKANWTTDDHMTPAFCVSLKAAFPNEWHCFDITPCIQYFFKPKKGLSQKDLNTELYHGKLQNYKDIGKHLHRYVLVDVKSGLYFFRYYNSAGENLADLLDFFWHAWKFKEDFPFQGVPFNIYADKGAANKNQFIRSVCEKLGIRLEHHKKGNPRAKIVEERMNFIQSHFECKLNFRSAMNILDLNKWAYEYCLMDNATRKHSRHKSTRLAVWTSLIRTEHKRLLDCAKEVFFGMAMSESRKAKVTPYRTIKFNSEEYLLHGPVNKEDWVWVDYNYFDHNAIRVWKLGENGAKAEELPTTLIKRNDLGEREDAVQLGQEWKRLEDTPAQAQMKEMDAIDYSKVGEVAFEHDLEKIPANIGFMEREGTPMFESQNPPVSPFMKGGNNPLIPPLSKGDKGGFIEEQRKYTQHEVFKEVRHRLKMEKLTQLQAQVIEKILGDKEVVEDSVIEEICNKLQPPVSPFEKGGSEAGDLFKEVMQG